jgi:hypothetical protein
MGHQTMDKVQKYASTNTSTPSSETYRSEVYTLCQTLCVCVCVCHIVLYCVCVDFVLFFYAFICMLYSFTTYSTSYCFHYKLKDPWNVCMYVRTRVYPKVSGLSR